MAYQQETEYALLLDLLPRLDNRIVLDVGAEKGSFVDACLAAGGEHVFAFEPYPPHVKSLHDRFDGVSAVTVYDVAIGAADGTAALHVATDRSGRAFDYHHSLVKFPSSREILWDQAIDVNCRSLSSLVRAGTIPSTVGLLKIDTEGGDLSVLQGLGDLRSALVVVEYWEGLVDSLGDSPYSVAELVGLLESRGYRDYVFIKRHDEFEMVQCNVALTRGADWGNLVFMHESVADRLMPVAHKAAAVVHERLMDRALAFRQECEKRLQVIVELNESLVSARGQEAPDNSRDDATGTWGSQAPQDDESRLPSAFPKVSIVTPSFNQGRFLEQTIRSVLDQDYPNLEYIIIDGKSTDESVSIIQKYAPRLAHWVSELDRGQADALNKGFARATGDIVAWVNSDDFYYPGAIAAAVAAFHDNPDLGLVYGRGNRVNEQGERISEFEATRPFDLEALVEGIDYILQPTTFMRRQALRDVGPLDRGMHYAFDWDLWIRLGKRFPVKMLDSVLAASREYAATKTSSGGFRRTEEIRRLVLRHTGNELSVGYLNYLLNAVLEALPTSRLAGANQLIAAVGTALSVCHDLLNEGPLEVAGDGRPRRKEIRPYADGWMGAEIRLRRTVPRTATFLCLSGIHDGGVAEAMGSLTLRASLEGRPLGLGVVLEPGPFTICWRLPPDVAGSAEVLHEVVVSSATVPASRLWQTDDIRNLSLRLGSLTFEAEAPPRSLVASAGWPNALDEIQRVAVDRYHRASSPGPHKGEKWVGPDLRMRRVLPRDATAVCLSGVHDDLVARVAGPLVLWASINGHPLGPGVVVSPGPFKLCWRLPSGEAQIQADSSDGSCEVLIATATLVIPSRFKASEDNRALAFRFSELILVTEPPPDAQLAGQQGASATEEIQRTAVDHAQLHSDGWAGPELRLRRPFPGDAAVMCLSGVHEQLLADVLGPLTLWSSLDGHALGPGIVLRPGPFTLCWTLPPDVARMHTQTAGRSCEIVIVTAASVMPSRFGPVADDRALAFRFRELSLAAAPPPDARPAGRAQGNATDQIGRMVTAQHHGVVSQERRVLSRIRALGGRAKRRVAITLRGMFR